MSTRLPLPAFLAHGHGFQTAYLRAFFSVICSTGSPRGRIQQVPPTRFAPAQTSEAITVLKHPDNDRKPVDMPTMPTELDSSRNGNLLLVDLGRKVPAIITKISSQTQGPLVRCVDWVISHHQCFNTPFLSGDLRRSSTDRVFECRCCADHRYLQCMSSSDDDRQLGGTCFDPDGSHHVEAFHVRCRQAHINRYQLLSDAQAPR